MFLRVNACLELLSKEREGPVKEKFNPMGEKRELKWAKEKAEAMRGCRRDASYLRKSDSDDFNPNFEKLQYFKMYLWTLFL